MLRTPPLIEDAIPSLDVSAYLAGGRAAHVVWHGLYQVVTGGSPGFAGWTVREDTRPRRRTRRHVLK